MVFFFSQEQRTSSLQATIAVDGEGSLHPNGRPPCRIPEEEVVEIAGRVRMGGLVARFLLLQKKVYREEIKKTKNKQTTDVRMLVSASGNGSVCYNEDVHLTVGYERSVTVLRNDNSVTLKSVRRTLPY